MSLPNRFTLLARVRYGFRYKTTVETNSVLGKSVSNFINQDLIVGLGVLYLIKENWKLGTGIGFYHKLNAYSEIFYPDGSYWRRGFLHKFLPNSHIQLEYCTGKLKYHIIFEYLYRVEVHTGFLNIHEIKNGKNALSFGISYEFYKTKKK